MRKWILALPLAGLLTGCGTEPTALSIPNPSTGQPDASGAKSKQENAASTVQKAGPSAASGRIESPVVQQLIGKARAAVVAGQNLVAVESISQAIGISPEDADLFRMRADVYVRLREMANARADFSTAIRLQPERADFRNYRGYFLMSQGLTKEAVEDFNEAIKLDVKHAPAWNNRGLVSLAYSEYQKAEADFSKAIEADRQFADGWNNRGFARMKQEKHDEAIADLKEAIRINDKYATAWNNLGLVYMAKEQYEEAANAFTRLIEVSPMDARWYNHRRSALLKLERFAEVQEDTSQIEWLTGLTQLTQQANANGRDVRVWINRGEYLMTGNQYGAAIQDFTRALMLNPGNTDALTGRAEAWLATKDLQNAIQDCDESIVVSPTPRAYSVRADVWLALNNLDQAIQDFETAGRFDDAVVSAYEKRSQAYRDKNEIEKADADAQRAADLRAALKGQIQPPAPTEPEPDFVPKP